MTDTFKEKLQTGVDSIGVSLSQEQMNQLFCYYEMLVETNKVMNLTAITEESEVVTKHFVDSMSIVRLENVSRETLAGKSLIDVGTGAGFPGLVLKIVFPELDIVLTDSLMKRLKFLDSVIEKLELENVKTIHGRAEDLGHRADLRERFDFAVSRAVANLSTLAEYDLPFVRTGGSCIAYKSAGIGEELEEAQAAIKILGGRLQENKSFVLTGDEAYERSLIRIEKVKKTAAKYPRKAGTPQKDPIHG